MYYPLLRARQFELIAIRELAIERSIQGYVVPILEPIKEAQNNLNLLFETFQAQDQQAYIIVNPSVGQFVGDELHFLNYLLGRDHVFLPAFHYRNNGEYIRRSITDFALNDCMLICKNDISADDDDFRDLATHAAISTINLEDPGKNRSIHRYIRGLHKTYIRLDDLFEKQARNSDFLQIEEHRFSEEHIYYQDEGFNGFSDYTVLPSEYSDGGSTPRAVVIHLTFLNGQNQIWIKHFTSESNDSIANVQGKFAEAAAKAITYCSLNNLTNNAIRELENYFDEEHYPGLGTIKKISIKNHLIVVAQFLRNR